MLNAYDGVEGYPLRTARSMFQKEIQLQKANDAGLHNVTVAELEDFDKPFITVCMAGRDGECNHRCCPQLRDKEPESTGRHCPLDCE